MSDLNVTRGKDSAAPPPALVREAPKEKQVYGRPGVSHRRRVFGYDRAEGYKNLLPFEGVVVEMGVMGVDEYRERSMKLDAMFGMVNVAENIMVAYHDVLFITYALLGGSQVSPGDRGQFTVAGVTRDWKDVMNFWGKDMRRAYRAVAREINEAVKNLIVHHDPMNPDQVFLREQVMARAMERGLFRHPHLIADCAEADPTLSAEERQAISRSKQAIISTSYNAVDSLNLAGSIQSAEGLNTTTGEMLGDVVKTSQKYRS